MDEIDDIDFTDKDPYFTPRPIEYEKLVAVSVQFLLYIISSLCVLITVTRSKPFRSQLLGQMLINYAIALLSQALVATKHIEMFYRRGIVSFGTVGCHLYFLGVPISSCAMNGSFIIICLVTTFKLPQNRVTRVVASLCVWLFALIFPVIILYGID